MAKKIGRTRNINDTPNLSVAIALNSTTSTTIQAANEKRTFFCLSNDGNNKIYLKLQPASTDNDKKGIPIPKNGYWEMPMDSIYPGEISAISDTGTPNVLTTEY